MTLIELLMAIAVMSIIALAMGMLASSVETGNGYAAGHAAAMQHGRVALERIRRHITTATASEDFPGFAVFGEQVGGYEYPDTLVIWHPAAQPSLADGPPLFSELVIYCPDPAAPNELVEITVPSDTRTTPPLTSVSTWRAELAAIKANPNAEKVRLLDMLRTAEADSLSPPRGVVRFVGRILPSQANWASFQSGSTTWDNLPWVQGIHGAQTGLRQSWCRFEIQLLARQSASSADDVAILPIFGSAALYYQLER